VGLFFLVKEG